MKCINCGADYSVNEANCPFCSTENPEAFKRINEKKRRIDIFHAVRLETLLKAGPVIVIKVLNRILLVCISIFILLMVAAFAFDAISLGEKNIRHEKHVENLEAIKETGKYNQLCTYLSDNSLSIYDGVEEYWQLYHMYQDFIDFRITRMEVADLTSEEIESDSYLITSLLNRARNLKEYAEETYRWDKLYDGNREIYADYIEEMEVSLMVTLNFSKQEIDDMFSSDPDGLSNLEPYVQLAKERILTNEENNEQKAINE